MPKNPIVEAIQQVGIPTPPNAGELYTPSHSMVGITLPPMRQQPLPLLDPELQRQREQIRAEEDAEIFRRLDATAEGGFGPGTRVSPGFIPGTMNIQAPMQVSHIYPRPGTHEWLLEAAQQQMDAEIIRDIEAAQQASVTPIREVGHELPVEYIPGRGTRETMTLENLRIDGEALRRAFVETPPGTGVFNPRGLSQLELFRDRLRGPSVSMGTRVAMPEFELASNPTVNIRDIATRRFDIVDRTYVPGRAIGERFRQEQTVQEEPHTNVPYDGPRPTSWEKILGGELIGD